MTRTFAAVAIAAASTLVTLGAQSAYSGAVPDKNGTRELKVTGCLERQPGADQPSGFMLTNVLGIGSREGLTGTSEGGGKTPALPKPAVSPETADKDPEMAHSSYRIGTVDPDVKLADHVGHRVELEGRVTEPDAPQAAAGQGAAAATETVPVLSVKSLRMVSSSCR